MTEFQRTGNAPPVERDSDTGEYRVSHTWWQDTSAVTGVVMAVAAITNTPMTDLPPLAEVTDPDALRDIYPTSDATTQYQAPSETTFEYYDCEVTIERNGDIRVRPLV